MNRATKKTHEPKALVKRELYARPNTTMEEFKQMVRGDLLSMLSEKEVDKLFESGRVAGILNGKRVVFDK